MVGTDGNGRMHSSKGMATVMARTWSTGRTKAHGKGRRHGSREARRAPRIQPRRETRLAADASVGGGGGSGNVGGRGGGDGGGKGDGNEGKGGWFGGMLGGLVKGWNERVAADPDFKYKVMVEQIIGVGAAVAGDMAGRPNFGLNELDFVFSTLVVGSIVNFLLMYLLAPTLTPAVAGGRGNPIAKLFSDATLANVGAPTGHIFQKGTFTLGQRATNVAFKGMQFGVVGISAGLTGTAVSNTLLAIRKKLDPSFEMQNEAPNVVLNALTWGLHMGVSSNLRYQVLNGLDMHLSALLPGGAFKLATSLIRTGNNVLGGVSFSVLARVLGVQGGQKEMTKSE